MKMNTSVFGKTMEKVRNRRDIKLMATDQRRNQWASVPSYHTTTQFWEKPKAIETNKINITTNKPVYGSVDSRHKQDSHVRILV